MGEPSMKDDLYREIASLDESDRERLLEFARSLGSSAPGTSGSDLLAFSGRVPESDMLEIEAAIEEGCEKVNPGAWQGPSRHECGRGASPWRPSSGSHARRVGYGGE